MAHFIQRLLPPPDHSFFLFGPRSIGKSFWLRRHFQDALFFDLLDNRTYLELSRDPTLLDAKIGNQKPRIWVCIDEIQKIPSLLNEVQRLMESKKYRFALSGSSARKLKRGGANLLAGRAITKAMEGFTYGELGESIGLQSLLEWGTLPLVALNPKLAADTLSAYVHTYIKEEIKEEGVVRRIEPFVRFLEIAGILNGQQLNKENVARDAKIPRSTVDIYFEVLVDTLLGHFLPPYRPAIKVREKTHPKFYWFDPGVARGAASLLYDPPDSVWLGKSLETLIFHELRVYNHISSKNRMISFYRTTGGSEIDFVIEIKKRTAGTKAQMVCLEVKYSKNWRREWEGPMRSLAQSRKIDVKKMFGVYCGKDQYSFDGVEVLPVSTFLRMLFKGEIF